MNITILYPNDDNSYPAWVRKDGDDDVVNVDVDVDGWLGVETGFWPEGEGGCRW